MIRNRPPGLFITGTDTGVGKTYVASLIARALAAAGLRVGVYKPVASGCEQVRDTLVSEDAVALWEAAGRPGDLERVCPQRFAAPLAPPAAARRAGRTVDADELRGGLRYWNERSDVVLVEGAGGLLSPLADDDLVADLASELEFPAIVVAKNVLGTIHHTLSACFVANHYRRPIAVAGVVLNDCVAVIDDESRRGNFQDIERWLDVAGSSRPHLTALGVDATYFDPPVDWRSLAG